MLTTTDHLARDIVVDILTRLPGKSLMRFKCVRKSWHALIESHTFIQQHFLKQTALNLQGKNNAYLVVQNRDKNNSFNVCMLSAETLIVVERTSPPPFFKQNGLRRIEASNGILCLDYFDNDTALWNPTTQEFKPIPLCPCSTFGDTHYNDSGNIGFSFDPKTNDYKVVKFVEHYFGFDEVDEYYYLVCLYTSSTDSWKRLDTSVVPSNCVIANSTAYVNGAHHFLAPLEENSALLSVDVADEVIRTLPLPDYATLFHCYGIYQLDLASFNGSLAFFVYPVKQGEKCFDFWVMNEYGVKESWTRQLTIGPLEGVQRPLGFWKNGGLFLEDVNEQLVLYDPNTQEIKNIQVKDHWGSLQLLNYVPSLFPINGTRKHEDGGPSVHSQTSDIQGHEDGASVRTLTSGIGECEDGLMELLFALQHSWEMLDSMQDDAFPS